MSPNMVQYGLNILQSMELQMVGMSIIFVFQLIKSWSHDQSKGTNIVHSQLKEIWDQAGLNKKKIQLNLRKTFSILIFNEFYLFS